MAANEAVAWSREHGAGACGTGCCAAQQYMACDGCNDGHVESWSALICNRSPRLEKERKAGMRERVYGVEAGGSGRHVHAHVLPKQCMQVLV